MKRHPRVVLMVLLVLILAVLGGMTVGAQTSSSDVRAAAAKAAELRVIVSLANRRLWVVGEDGDTLLSSPVAVGSGKTLRAGGNVWTFTTPRGIRTVLSKETDPLWIRPVWSYVEVAREYNLKLDSVSLTRPRPIARGRTLIVRGDEVGVIGRDSAFEALPVDDEIVFGNVLYVPPIGTAHRAIAGTLGAYRLNLGDGIGLHGTPDDSSVGRAVTHGCLRLGDDALAWVFANIPVGTHVYIY